MKGCGWLCLFTVYVLFLAKQSCIFCSQFVLGRNSKAIKLSSYVALIVLHSNFSIVGIASPMGAFAWGKVLNGKLKKPALNFANIINDNLMSF